MTHDATDWHVPGFATLAVHAGARSGRAAPGERASADADPAGAMFGLDTSGDLRPRLADTASAVLEERVAALEGGTAALAVASGQAALGIVFHTLMEPGDEFIASTAIHAGSVDRFDHAFERFGWRVRWADPADPAAFAAQTTDRTRAIFVESLANPGGGLADVDAIAAVARHARVPLIVDNTLASPYLFRPIEHGADIVVHSAATVLCGHRHAAGGIVVDGGSFDWMADGRHTALSRPRPECGGMVLGETFGNFAFAVAARVLGLRDLGAALSPVDALAILTGIETLPLRMRRQCDNALEVATWLSRHPAVARVGYPGLPGDQDHARAARHFPKGAGAVLSFGVEGGGDGMALASRLKLFSLRADAGDARSSVVRPASTTGLRPADDGHGEAGAEPDAVRLSVGIEDAADLIADLDQALSATGAA